MIQIFDKKKCCGCLACVQKCPQQCISVYEDKEGFLYPKVELDKCINCHLCEKVCPYVTQNEAHKPLICYAAKNLSELIRRESSSGGVFTPVAEYVIAKGGVVFGARFNQNWQVQHSYTENRDGIEPFRGSKYVQSYIGETFKQTESFLKKGRIVLFSGTPCQILGLKNFLRKEYENLITLEIVCHGVPSPKIWKEYFKSLELSNIGTVSHKDKLSGWKGYSFSVKDISNKILFVEKAYENKYLIAFSRNLILRPSCFMCPAKSGKSRADITLADYWGIEKFYPQMDDDIGTSFVCCNSQKGLNIIDNLKQEFQLVTANYQNSIIYNSCIEKSTDEPKDRKLFWDSYNEIGITVVNSLKNKKQNILKRIIKRLIK